MAGILLCDLSKESVLMITTLLGIYLGVYYLLILALFSKGAKKSRQNYFMIAYSSLQFILNTLFFISIPHLGQLMWIIHRDSHIGGPEAYFDMYYGHAHYILLGSEAQNIAILLADALLESLIICSSSFFVMEADFQVYRYTGAM
jgi:hypothetical protein